MISMFSKTLAGRGRTSVIRAISSVGATSFFLRQQALKCDESPQFVSTSYAKKHHLVSPRTISQLATGSLAGLCAGVVLRVFSPLIALVSGLAVMILVVASRYGIASNSIFRGVLRASRVGYWGETGDKIVFNVTFVTALMLASFLHL